MSSRAPSPSASRRMPVTVRIALGQIILAVVAFAAVPTLALKRAISTEPSSSAAELSTGAAAIDSETDTAAANSSAAPADPLAHGETIFGQSCAACHQPTGAGIPGAFPPLAGSDFLLADPERAVGIVLHGLSGPVTVNGIVYESVMPPMPLEDGDVAAVLTYVLQAWGNQGPAVTAETVARVRAAGPKS